MPDSGPLHPGRFVRSRARQSLGRVVEALHHSVVGESVRASAAASALGVVLAAANAWLVGTSVGGEAIATRFLAALTGQASVGGVLVALCVLVALGATAAVAGAGFVPTALLVGAPVFGIGVTRFGTEYAVAGHTFTVTLSEAVLDATGAALVVGVPLAVLGFGLGVAARWTRGETADAERS